MEKISVQIAFVDQCGECRVFMIFFARGSLKKCVLCMLTKFLVEFHNLTGKRATHLFINIDLKNFIYFFLSLYIYRCSSCLARWFASRQEQSERETWLSSKASCPMCRSIFCILDVSPLEESPR